MFLNTKTNVITNLKPSNSANNCISLRLVTYPVPLSCSLGLKEFKTSTLQLLA